MRPAQLGEQVYVILDPADNSGSSIATGWVVRSWERPATRGGIASQTVNVKVMPDRAEDLYLPSINLFEERPQPEDLAQMFPHNPMGYRMVAFRHPRVEGF